MSNLLSSWEYTKIVATIGPASDTVPLLEELMLAGMSVARLNTKHGTSEWHAERIDRIREAAKNVGKYVPILLDLQGPEIRGNIKDQGSFNVEKGEEIYLVAQHDPQFSKQIIIPQSVIDSLKPGNEVLLEDGASEFIVKGQAGRHLVITAQLASTVKDRKTVNCPGVSIEMPSLITADLEKLEMLKDHPVEYVALSFVRDKHDIEILAAELKKREIQAEIVAKIENQAAIDNVDEIIEHSDAVMVARGDLAVEIPMEQITYWQKEIIDRCRALGKPVITATQMLKSMVDNARPTRAEVSDVANAVYDGTDAIMLSEETTIGKYPVKTVQTMRRIAAFNEKHANVTDYASNVTPSRTRAVTKMAISLLKDNIEPIDLVLVLTETGYTARQLSRLRPYVPVIAISDRESTVSKLSLSYGIRSIFHDFPEGKIEDIKHLIDRLQADQYLEKGERLLVIHGTIFKKPGFTNTVTVVEVE